MKRSRELTEDRRQYIPLAGNVVLDLLVGERGSRVHARSTPTVKRCSTNSIIKIFTFMKAHSFWAASRDIYIHEADLRFPK